MSDTSPISNLAKVGQLNLLQQIYEIILIPTAACQELLNERAGEVVVAAVRSAVWLEVQPVQNQALVSELRDRVNVGEAEAIVLAIEVNADRLLIDERLGRQVAADFGVGIVGILGVLLTAKCQGLIAVVKPTMDDLISEANFRVSSQLYATVLQAAGE